MEETTEKYHPLPQPEEIKTREREDAMGAYLMMFAAIAAGLPLPILNLIAAIIYYYVNRSVSRFVHFHALQSLYAQIPTSLLNAGLVFWTVNNLFADRGFDDNYKGYLLMVIAANILYFIFSIIAAVRARKGRLYYFVFFGKLAYQQVYAIREGEGSEKKEMNVPPGI